MNKEFNTQLNKALVNNTSKKEEIQYPQKVKVFETCSGIGCTSLALRGVAKRLGIEFECVGFSEIDPIAIKAYNAIHGDGHRNYGDLTKIDWSTIYCDVLSFTFPCVAISKACGKNASGFDENVNNTSSIVWELKRILNTMPQKPKMIFMENVSDILNKRNKATFDKLIEYLESEGYFVRYEMLDSAKHGIAQHRERVYIICTYGEDVDFTFPKEKPLETKLWEILEKDANPKYTLSNLQKYFIKHSLNTSYTFRVHNPSHCEIAHTITTKSGSRISDNYVFEKDLSQDKEIHIKPKYLALAEVALEEVENAKIRKLTRGEVMTLMGLSKETQEKLIGISDCGIFKLMGNGIVVPLLEDIFYEYFKALLDKHGIENIS